MKMTMHIDEAVLDQVMDLTGAASKTQAVEIALNDLARRHRLRKTLRGGLGLTPSQWDTEAQAAADQLAESPDIDVDRADAFLKSLRVNQSFESSVVAEPPSH